MNKRSLLLNIQAHKKYIREIFYFWLCINVLTPARYRFVTSFMFGIKIRQNGKIVFMTFIILFFVDEGSLSRQFDENHISHSIENFIENVIYC